MTVAMLNASSGFYRTFDCTRAAAAVTRRCGLRSRPCRWASAVPPAVRDHNSHRLSPSEDILVPAAHVVRFRISCDVACASLRWTPTACRCCSAGPAAAAGAAPARQQERPEAGGGSGGAGWGSWNAPAGARLRLCLSKYRLVRACASLLVAGAADITHC